MNLQNKSKKLSIVFSLLFSTGLLVFINWILNLNFFGNSLNPIFNMKINTSLCLMLSSLIFLLVVNNKNKNLIITLGLMLLLFSSAIFLQDIFNINIGIDEFIISDSVSTINPGRSAPITLICVILISLAVLGFISKKELFKTFAQYLLHFVTLLTFIAIIGYAYKLSFLTSIPLISAVSFYILSVAASFINHNIGLTGMFTGVNIGSVMARNLFPKIFLTVLLLALIRIKTHEEHLVSVEFGIALFGTSFILVSLYFISITAKMLNAIDIKRNQAELELQLYTKNLEDTVSKRTFELNQTNLELEKNKTYFKKLFDINAAATIIYCIEEENQQYTEVNTSFENLMGYSREEVIGKSAIELAIVEPADYTKIIELSTHQGFVRNEEINLTSKQGEVLTVLASIENFEIDNKKFILSSFIDISDRKIKEEKLNNLTKYLEHQNKQLEDFSFIISHNLRGSSGNLRTLLMLHAEETNLEEKAFLISKMEQTVDNLSETLNNLLEVVTIRSDLKNKKEKLSFEKIFLKILQSNEGQIIKTKAVVNYDFNNVKNINYIAHYLESILHNMLSNALKYSSPNRIPNIAFETFEENKIIHLKVSDNGLGIDLVKNGSKLFGLNKVFHRHADAKGVGLFITKAQITSMGGEIIAESQVDVGTTFTILFNKHKLN